MKYLAEDFKKAVEPYSKKFLKQQLKKSKEKRESLFDIYICLLCDRVFEIFRNGGRISQIYYTDFPRLHLEKEICKHCLNSQSNAKSNITTINPTI